MLFLGGAVALSWSHGDDGGGVSYAVTRCGDADVASERSLGIGDYLAVPVALGKLEARWQTQFQVYCADGVADRLHLDS